MKKHCIILLLFMACVWTLFSQKSETENYAFSQLKNYYSSGVWSLLLEKSNGFLEKHPFSTYKEDVLYYTAESYYHLSNFSKSKEVFEYVLENSKSNEDMAKSASYWLGIIFAKEGEYQRALTYFFTLVEKPFGDERDKDVLLYSARSLSSLRRLDELKAVIEFYIKNYGENTIPAEIEPLLGSLWLGMGVAAFEDNRFTEALEYFKRADLQKIIGDENPLHYEQSGLYQAAIHYINASIDEAIVILENRLQYEGDTTFEYVAFLSILYAETGNYSVSGLYAKEALTIFQSSDMDYEGIAHFTLLQNSQYWLALYNYEKGLFTEAANILDTFELIAADYYDSMYKTSDTLMLLHAQSLYNAGQEDKALLLFDKYFPLSEETIKALFMSSEWEKGSKVAFHLNNAFLHGISNYYYKNWDEAQKNFSEYLPNGVEPTLGWAQYYLGLSMYYNGMYSKSAKILSSFIQDNPVHSKIWDAQLVSAICFLEQGVVDSALTYSLSAIRTSKTSEQKQIATVFAAGLYIDNKQYKSANELLSEYSSSTDARSIAPRMLLSETYVKLGNIEQADNELKEIVSLFPNAQEAREASYKRGELYFNSNNLQAAERLFKEFRFTYSDGIYTDFALFFEAESRLLQNDVNGAILLYLNLVNRYVNSSYRFASLGQLVLAHRQLEEYGIALETVLQAQSEYPRDFAASSLSTQLSELQILASGADEDIARIQFEWEKEGKNSNPVGRQLGYDLALLYVQNIGDSKSALDILEELNTILQNTSEYSLHANVLDLLASIQRNEGNCLNAARYYLQEVEVLAKLGNEDTQSAKALYGSIEAFDCAGLFADANAIYEEMEKKYTDSIWYARAKLIIGVKN